MGYQISAPINQVFEPISKIAAPIVDLIRQELEIERGNPIFIDNLDIELKIKILALIESYNNTLPLHQRNTWGGDPRFWMQNLQTIEDLLEKYGEILID